MQDSYWSRFTESRLSRRRALTLTGGTALGAAFLAACGGSDSDSGGGSSSGPKDNSGLLTQMKDQTSQAKRGGVLIGSHPGVILSWDPFKTGINIRGGRRGFSQLFRIQDGIVENTKGAIEGDLAESWELSPDKLTLTVKLDPGAGLPPVPQIANGRVMDSSDVLFTWDRMKKQGTFRTELVNELNPGAPIVSMTAPDAKTVVIKMSEPNATIYSLLGTDALGYLFIQPKEAGDKWDPDKQAIGSGPFYITDYSEVSYRWKRNPNFKRAKLKNNEPYVDEIFEPVIPDIATGEAQFRSGAIYWYGVPSANIVSTKRDVKDLLMYSTNPNITGTERVYFGLNSDSPFKDERVRIAYMKCMDRDAFIIAAHNTDRFSKEGLPVEEYWEGGLGAGTWTGWYLNPKDEKAFGANAKNYKYDLAEAKKMIEAAGLKTPLDITEIYAAPSPTSFPASFYTRAEIFMGMIENSGVFRMKRDLITYQDWNTEKVRFSKGKFSGATWGPDTATGDPSANAFFLYNSKGGYYQGGDDKLDELTAKARSEFDDKKRQELVHEVQRYNGGKFWNNKIGTAGGFALQWPIVSGQQGSIFRGGTNWMDLRAFIDPTLPPRKGQ
jgi:dipeptide transport system substrate-binding protein